jgi:hypothetical protein
MIETIYLTPIKECISENRLTLGIVFGIIFGLFVGKFLK